MVIVAARKIAIEHGSACALRHVFKRDGLRVDTAYNTAGDSTIRHKTVRVQHSEDTTQSDTA